MFLPDAAGGWPKFLPETRVKYGHDCHMVYTTERNEYPQFVRGCNHVHCSYYTYDSSFGCPGGKVTAQPSGNHSPKAIPGLRGRAVSSMFQLGQMQLCRHTQSARSNVSSNQHAATSRAEILEGTLSLVLNFVAVDGYRDLREIPLQFITHPLGGAEN